MEYRSLSVGGITEYDIMRAAGVERPRLSLRKTQVGLGGRLLYWEFAERVRKSMKWHNVESAAVLTNKFHRKAALICGGGPSLNDELHTIRALQARGGYVVSVNKTHDHLLGLEQPIVPFGHVLLDPMPWVSDYTNKVRAGVNYFVASSCDPTVSRRIRARGGKVYLWHAGADFYGVPEPMRILKDEFPDKAWLVAVGPTTVGLRSIMLLYQFGFRVFHLFGLDSSMRADANGVYALHAYPKERPKDSEEGVITLSTRTGEYEFYTNNHMSKQMTDFEDILEQIGELVVSKTWEPVSIVVHGDGLLPTYAASVGLHANPLMNQRYGGQRAA